MPQFKVLVYNYDGSLKSKDETDDDTFALAYAKNESRDSRTSVVWSTNLMKIYHIYINGIQVSGSY